MPISFHTASFRRNARQKSHSRGFAALARRASAIVARTSDKASCAARCSISFAALLAGAGVAIGAAWSGMLGNFAAGAFMLVLRPFKVGDFVSVGGITGTVHELGLFGTTIVTPDHVMTVVGNGKIFADTIQNFSALPVRRVERTAQLAGGVDPLDAIARFKAAVAKIPNVATDPAPEVNLLDMTLVGPVISVRPYTGNDHYWQVYFDTNEMIVRVCREAGWPAPTPTQIIRQG